MRITPMRGYALVLWCETEASALIVRPQRRSGTRPLNVLSEDDVQKDDRHESGYEVGRVLAVNPRDHTEFGPGDHVLYQKGTCPTIGWPARARTYYAQRAQARLDQICDVPPQRRTHALMREFETLLADQAERTRKEARESIGAHRTLAALAGHERDDAGNVGFAFFVPLWAVDFRKPGAIEPGEVG